MEPPRPPSASGPQVRARAGAALAGVLLASLLSATAGRPSGAPDPAAPFPTPASAGEADLAAGFRNPPPGYGEVPFWWWTGDPLDRGRLLWQIEALHAKGVAGMQVNYSHEDTPGWPTSPASPAIFSDAWWDVWRFVVEECRKRGMSIGLSGYTLDWPGQAGNLFGRLVYSDPDLNGRELAVERRAAVGGGERLDLPVSGDVVAVHAYRDSGGTPERGGIELTELARSGRLEWSAPAGGPWQVWVFAARRKPLTLDPMDPRAGRTVVERFFQPFEDRSGGTSAGLNWFFQDELQFGVSGLIWTADFAAEFRRRKGYDLEEALPALFEDVGPETPKVRLDYADVKVALEEERYFRPIFEWHAARGLVYGCDPGSRGTDPAEFGDYFRCMRWYTAPGHDTPGGKADLVKDKVSSSIAHLYGRPRVWLEGYHSLGWGATPAALMAATRENFLYGANLLNLHGLYYTTHGSFWEWAPPCYHFRQPYWAHMGTFLRYFERLSFLLTRGVHRCDVAILYPVAPFDADMGGKDAAAAAFETGRALMAAGRDFDFIDFESLARAEARDRRLEVAGESYRALVLPAMRAIRWSSLEAARAFRKAGGVVLAVGALPEASDRAGRDDPELRGAVDELFGAGGGGVALAAAGEVPAAIAARVPADVSSAVPADEVRTLHRRVGERDVYMVLGASRGSEATFRAGGRPELWDPWSGGIRPLRIVSRGDGATTLRLPLEPGEAQVVVFSPGEPVMESAADRAVEETAPARLAVEGSWEFELVPTMDNRWGDFRLPATEKMIGAEARLFRHAVETGPGPGWERPKLDDSSWPVAPYGFGPKLQVLGPLPAGDDPGELDAKLAEASVDASGPVRVGDRAVSWRPYEFSWRWGAPGDPGHQGFHGLKERVTDDFLCLGAAKEGLNETLYVEEPGGRRYYVRTRVTLESDAIALIRAGGLAPAAIFVDGRRLAGSETGIDLKKGTHRLLVRYDSPGRGHFVLERKGVPARPDRSPLAMSWYDRPGVLPFEAGPAGASGRPAAGWYRFVSPPGLRAMTVTAAGTIRAWADGKPCEAVRLRETDHAFVYRVSVPSPSPDRVVVALRVEPWAGESGGAALPEPVLLECGPGRMPLGDWSRGSALECYSGGAWYRKTVTLDRAAEGGRATLDLGEVAATAEVRVNGRAAAILVAPPWRVEIGPFLRPGRNRLEVLVYNTLANHYLTIPTRYGGSTRSGLIGPVALESRPRARESGRG